MDENENEKEKKKSFFTISKQIRCQSFLNIHTLCIFNITSICNLNKAI